MHTLALPKPLPNEFGDKRAERRNKLRARRKHIVQRGVERQLLLGAWVVRPHARTAAPDVPVVKGIEERRKEPHRVVYPVCVEPFRD